MQALQRLLDTPTGQRPKLCVQRPSRSKSASESLHQAARTASEVSALRSMATPANRNDSQCEEEGQVKKVLQWQSATVLVDSIHIQGNWDSVLPIQPPASRHGPYLSRDTAAAAPTSPTYQRPSAPPRHRGSSPSAVATHSTSTSKIGRSPRLDALAQHDKAPLPAATLHGVVPPPGSAGPSSSPIPSGNNFVAVEYSNLRAGNVDIEPAMPSRYTFVASRSTITASPASRSMMVSSPVRAFASPGRNPAVVMALAGCAPPSDSAADVLSSHLSSSPAVRFDRPSTPEKLVSELQQAHHVRSPNKRDGEVPASDGCRTPEAHQPASESLASHSVPSSIHALDGMKSSVVMSPEGSPQRRMADPVSPNRKPSPSRRYGGVRRKTFTALPPVAHWPRIQDVLQLLDTWRDKDSWDPMDKYAAILLLSNVASDTNSHPVLEEHECVEFLGHLMGDPEATLEQKLAATFALQNLAKSPSKTLQSRIVRVGVVVHLVNILKSPPPEQPAFHELQSASAQSLRAIAFMSEQAKQAIVAEGGVAALADLIRLGSTQISAEAVPALRTLSFSTLPGTDDSFGNACEVLLSLVMDPEAEMGVREDAAGALQNLSVWTTIRSRIATAEVIPRLLRLFTERAVSELALESIAVILSNLAGDEASQCTMLDAGAIPALLSSVDFSGTPSSTKAHLMATVHKLLVHKEARQQVCQGGGFNVILRELWIGSDVPAIQTCAAGAVIHLAMDSSTRAELGATGVISALLNLLMVPPSVEALANAAGALGFLCVNDAHNKQRVWELGGVQIMLDILTDAEAPDRIVMSLGECLQSLSVEREGAQVLINSDGPKVLLGLIVRSRLRPQGPRGPSNPSTPMLTRVGARCRLEAMLADTASHRAVFLHDADSSDSEAEEELRANSIVCPAMATLQNLSIFSEGVKAIVEAGGAAIMKQLLRSEGNLRMVRDCAVGVLSNLLLEDSCQLAVLQEDGIPLFALRLYNPDASQYEKETILEMFLDLALGPYTASMLDCGLVMVLVCILEEVAVAVRLKRLACSIVCKLATRRSYQAALVNADCVPVLLRFLHAYHHTPELKDSIEQTIRTLQALPSWLTWRPREAGEDGGDVAEPLRPLKALRKKKGVKNRDKPFRERRATMELSNCSPRICWLGAAAGSAPRRSSINVSPVEVTRTPATDWI
eukprot:GGOE01058803.1.p1 GENE.GGOE01058803.1~~GGOE01058803.1.p1  ORF type:complete len:1359 (-),score=271.66 GGOE01058803.1:594-4133(-)